MSLRERIAAITASWPHPLWAGFKRKTWKWYGAGSLATTTVAAAAVAVPDVLPNEDIRVVAILAGVLAGLGALLVVLVKVMGQIINALGELLPRRAQRGAKGETETIETCPATGAHLVADGALSALTTQISGLREDVKDIERDYAELLVKWSVGRVEDKAVAQKLIEDHHVQAMAFLSTAIEDIEKRMATRVERKLGEAVTAAMAGLRIELNTTVRDAITEAMKQPAQAGR